ncbi:hypothetical protein D3C79_982120 [compost metagenome]
MAEYDRFHLRADKLKVTGMAGRLEQRRTQGWHHLPVAVKGVDVTLGNATAQMAVDILNVLRLGTVDVARQVEVKVVLRIADFVEGHHARVARVAFIQPDEGIDNPVHILIA